MPRLNLYEQQTSAQGPRSSGAEFGAAPAQALEGMGAEMFKIGERIQERENLSDRQRLRESFEEAAVPMLDDFDKKKDINSKESIPQFRQALMQKRQELVEPLELPLRSPWRYSDQNCGRIGWIGSRNSGTQDWLKDRFRFSRSTKSTTG